MKRLVTEGANEWQPWEAIFRYWCGDIVTGWSGTFFGFGVVHTNITGGGL
jgi:hypothetical protein